MKNTNQNDSKNQGKDQQSKTGKGQQQNDRNENKDQQNMRGSRDNSGRQENDSSNWQKEKQKK
jgi:hypothetical protein